MYVVGGTGEEAFFDVADVSDPLQPFWRHTPKFSEFDALRSMAFAGGRFFTAGRKAEPASGHGYARQLVTFDIDGDGPSHLAEISDDIGALRVTAIGDLLFVASGNDGVAVYRAEVQGPATLLGTFPTAGTASLVRPEPGGGAVLVLEGQGGIERFVTGPLGE